MASSTSTRVDTESSGTRLRGPPLRCNCTLGTAMRANELGLEDWSVVNSHLHGRAAPDETAWNAPRTDPSVRNYRTGLLPWVMTRRRWIG